jgi:hypothetical protein
LYAFLISSMRTTCPAHALLNLIALASIWWSVFFMELLQSPETYPRLISLCLTKHHTMKKYLESGGTALRIHALDARWRWVVSFTPRQLYPQGKAPGTHWIGGLVCQITFSNRSLYILSYNMTWHYCAVSLNHKMFSRKVLYYVVTLLLQICRSQESHGVSQSDWWKFSTVNIMTEKYCAHS